MGICPENWAPVKNARDVSICAKRELQRLLDVLERTQDSSFRSKVKLHLAKALGLFCLIYASTGNSELKRLLREAELQSVDGRIRANPLS
jgi:hypothetical protein